MLHNVYFYTCRVRFMYILFSWGDTQQSSTDYKTWHWIFTCSHAFVVHLSHTQKHTRAEWNSFAELISCFVEDIIRMMRSNNNNKNCLRAEWTKEVDNVPLEPTATATTTAKNKCWYGRTCNLWYKEEMHVRTSKQSKYNTAQHSTT